MIDLFNRVSGYPGAAHLDGSGGGDLNLTGSTVEPEGNGIVVDGAAGKVYYLGGTNEVGFANVNGSGGGDVPSAGAVINGPWGVAFDPSIGRFYLGNYENKTETSNAIGVLNLSGGGGGITPTTAPVNGPQDPVVLKSPSGIGGPTATRSAGTTNLSCSQGSWGADYAASFLYQAPQSYGYQWLLNGAPIGGANSSAYTASGPGSYSCSVTASNRSGSASQTSNSVDLTPGSLTMSIRKHKVRTKAGHPGVFVLVASNSGDFAVSGASLCVKAPKKTRKAAKTPKCRAFEVAAHGTTTLKLRLKAKKNARGTYVATLLVKGSVAVAPLKAKLQVMPKKNKKKHHRKHHHRKR